MSIYLCLIYFLFRVFLYLYLFVMALTSSILFVKSSSDLTTCNDSISFTMSTGRSRVPCFRPYVILSGVNFIRANSMIGSTNQNW